MTARRCNSASASLASLIAWELKAGDLENAGVLIRMLAAVWVLRWVR